VAWRDFSGGERLEEVLAQLVTPPETEAFTEGVSNGKVKFNWSGFHKELVSELTPADVQWTCERLARLSGRQWQDAFRAGGYEPMLAERYIRRFKQKIAEGLALR